MGAPVRTELVALALCIVCAACERRAQPAPVVRPKIVKCRDVLTATTKDTIWGYRYDGTDHGSDLGLGAGGTAGGGFLGHGFSLKKCRASSAATH